MELRLPELPPCARSGIRCQATIAIILVVSLDGHSWAVLNASPDIRQQIIDNSALHPKALRDSPIKSVLITNGDIDHLAGLLILREKQPLEIFVTAAIGRSSTTTPSSAPLIPPL